MKTIEYNGKVYRMRGEHLKPVALYEESLKKSFLLVYKTKEGLNSHVTLYSDLQCEKQGYQTAFDLIEYKSEAEQFSELLEKTENGILCWVSKGNLTGVVRRIVKKKLSVGFFDDMEEYWESAIPVTVKCLERMCAETLKKFEKEKLNNAI
jgi:hypothetical protein